MKNIHYVLVLWLVLFVAAACGSKRSVSQIAADRTILMDKIENRQFYFKADYVIPQGNFRSRHLTPSYGVKVSRDTVYSHLPYFGVAYQAPLDLSGSPLIFNSTVFDYSITKGKKEGSWFVNIAIRDKHYPSTYIFTVWDNAKASLTIQDAMRQSITFMGEIEISP